MGVSLKISIACVGKIKEKFYKDAISEYEKRLSRYCKLEFLEVADEKTPDGASEALEEQIKEKEARRLLEKIREDAFVCTLEIEGKRLTSEGFARWMEGLTVRGTSHIVFVIGGSLGLHESLRRRADMALSFSDMTFPHQLMRVILVEQIYRGFRIMHGEPYHK
jgi:23S rRNA (pseudouridine1915-N3)-methyltransferase